MIRPRTTRVRLEARKEAYKRERLDKKYWLIELIRFLDINTLENE